MAARALFTMLLLHRWENSEVLLHRVVAITWRTIVHPAHKSRSTIDHWARKHFLFGQLNMQKKGLLSNLCWVDQFFPFGSSATSRSLNELHSRRKGGAFQVIWMPAGSSVLVFACLGRTALSICSWERKKCQKCGLTSNSNDNIPFTSETPMAKAVALMSLFDRRHENTLHCNACWNEDGLNFF
jgi:hypothetical protein